MISRFATSIVPALLLAGCTNDASDETRPLCEPSDTSGARVAASVQGAFMVVDRQCTYWANNPGQRFAETRTGTLTAAQATELGTFLQLGTWASFSGWYYSGATDVGSLYFDDGERAIQCDEPCTAQTAPPFVIGLASDALIVAEGLWNRGVALSSPVHVSAMRTGAEPGVTYVDWPLARPISEFADTIETDPSSVAALKELRASFARGEHREVRDFYMPIKSGADYSLLTVGDVLPFAPGLTGEVGPIRRN